MGVRRDLKEAYKTKWDIGRVSTGQRDGLLKLGFGDEAVHLGPTAGAAALGDSNTFRGWGLSGGRGSLWGRARGLKVGCDWNPAPIPAP